jgi:hypothetical protein
MPNPKNLGERKSKVKNPRVDRQASGSRPGRELTFSEPELTPRPSALSMKLGKASNAANLEEMLDDARVGIVEWPFYTITMESNLIIASNAEVDAKVKGLLYDLWWADKWRHLINPPHWLEIEHFINVVPVRSDVSQVIPRIREAERNLKLTRLREQEGGLTEAVIDAERL